MGKIIQLDTHLSNQISAGEVVERPVSVIKELVENSIDAGATFIKIEIQQGGKKSISIQDDGEGISYDDLLICIDKYTTSKIKTLQDLYNVMTFGFRGEALASISSVSQFSIFSKHKNSTDAYKLSYDNINGKQIDSTVFEKGTKIQVDQLFFNTPARLNYLKTEKTEYTKILEYLYSVSLSYPNIGFEFINDTRQVFKFNPDELLPSRIYSIYGSDFFDHILSLEFESTGIRVYGCITDPKVTFPNKNRQNLFVNHRPVVSPLIFKAINDAYNRFIPHGLFPGYVLYIEVDPTLLDVNVHPRKQEVRFENEQNIFRSVYHAVLDKLESSSLVSQDLQIDGQSMDTSENTLGVSNKVEGNNFGEFSKPSAIKSSGYTGSGTKFQSYSPYKNTQPSHNQSTLSDAVSFTKDMLSFSSSLSGSLNDSHIGDLHYTKLGRIVGQAFNSYIIVEQESKMILLDQHALAERIIYEKLCAVDIGHSRQKLLVSENIKLTPGELDFLYQYSELFVEMGFDFEILSNGIISIHSVPDFIKKESIQHIFLGVIQDIMDGNTKISLTLQEVKNKMYAYTACRSAIKFGHKLNLFEMNKLLQDSVDGYTSTCPHGRPVIFELGLDELKKLYER